MIINFDVPEVPEILAEDPKTTPFPIKQSWKFARDVMFPLFSSDIFLKAGP